MSSILLRNARIFDGVRDGLSAPTSVLIEGDRIENIGAEGAQADTEIDIDGLAVKVGQLRIVGGHHPGALGA